MKKIKSLFFVASLTISMISGCSQSTAVNESSTSRDNKQQSDYPTRPITVIVSGSVGGGTDVGTRMTTAYWEKELGVPMPVSNISGARGQAIINLAKAKPNGYTIGMLSVPLLPAFYLDPETQSKKISLDSFTPIANLVSDYGVICIRAEEKRFTNVKELFEYAKKNEVTAAAASFGGDDHVAILKINKASNTKMVPVFLKSTTECLAGVLGGHVDVLFANVSEVYSNKQLKVIAVMSKTRSPYLPEVPTLEESGYPNIINSSSRGILAFGKLDPASRDILVRGLEKVNKNEEYLKKMKDIGMQIEFIPGEEYKKFLIKEEETLISIKSLFGW